MRVDSSTERFSIRTEEVSFVGHHLSRPECIVAEPDGTLYTAVHLRSSTRLTTDGKLLVCMRHFAQFDVQTGVCVAGACLGSELDRIAVHVDENHNIRIG
jgi:nitrite reductase/ring-hydroxylating ferredoxin subunit